MKFNLLVFCGALLGIVAALPEAHGDGGRGRKTVTVTVSTCPTPTTTPPPGCGDHSCFQFTTVVPTPCSDWNSSTCPPVPACAIITTTTYTVGCQDSCCPGPTSTSTSLTCASCPTGCGATLTSTEVITNCPTPL